MTELAEEINVKPYSSFNIFPLHHQKQVITK